MPLEEHVSEKNIFWSTIIGKSRERKKITSHIVLLSYQPISTANLAHQGQRHVLQEAFIIDISQCVVSKIGLHITIFLLISDGWHLIFSFLTTRGEKTIYLLMA